MERYVKYNENPRDNRVGDCTVRAISTLTGEDWDTTYILLCVQGFLMKNMPSANCVWGAYLRACGYHRAIVPDECPDCYTVERFCEDHPNGKYMLALSSHVVAVIDGRAYDTWNSLGEIVNYYWYKEEEK